MSLNFFLNEGELPKPVRFYEAVRGVELLGLVSPTGIYYHLDDVIGYVQRFGELDNFISNGEYGVNKFKYVDILEDKDSVFNNIRLLLEFRGSNPTKHYELHEVRGFVNILIGWMMTLEEALLKVGKLPNLQAMYDNKKSEFVGYIDAYKYIYNFLTGHRCFIVGQSVIDYVDHFTNDNILGLT